MTVAPPSVRILPMSTDEDEFRNKTTGEVQQEFFRTALPERDGEYWYRTSGLNAEPGAIILFQFNNQIIAQAEFERRRPFKRPKEGVYRGSLHFKPATIHTFDPPLDASAIREFWPTLVRFGNNKPKLDGTRYQAFHQRYVGAIIDSEAINLLVCQLPDRALLTGWRIVRDTELTMRVKELHNFECQICGQTITLPDKSRYAEGHHVRPRCENGPEDTRNILCLCPNHHAACDLGAILLDEKTLRKVEGHEIGAVFIEYHNTHRYPAMRGKSAGASA